MFVLAALLGLIWTTIVTLGKWQYRYGVNSSWSATYVLGMMSSVVGTGGLILLGSGHLPDAVLVFASFLLGCGVIWPIVAMTATVVADGWFLVRAVGQAHCR